MFVPLLLLAIALALYTAFEMHVALDEAAFEPDFAAADPRLLDTPSPRNRNTADQLADVRGEGERVIHGEDQVNGVA
jgi:hypothetical protein